MKNIITQIFVTLGVILLILVLIGLYFFIADPYNLKSLFSSGSAAPQSYSPADTDVESTADSTDSSATTTAVASGGFELSRGQKEALVSLGIDPDAVPDSVSAEQEACFAGVLGEERVAEIKAGAVPSNFELLKAQSCIE